MAAYLHWPHRPVVQARAGQLTWEVMDATRLTFPAGRFGGVVDKGTLDAILCGDESTANARRLCEHVARVLRPGGVYVVVSYGPPENRLGYLEDAAFGWKVAHTAVAKPVISGDAPVAGGAPPPAAAAASPASGAGSGNSPPAAPQEQHHIYICRKV